MAVLLLLIQILGKRGFAPPHLSICVVEGGGVSPPSPAAMILNLTLNLNLTS